MTTTTIALVAFAASLDLLVGEPRTRHHPVAWFGRLVAAVDRDRSLGPRGRRTLGLAVALVLPAVAGALVGGLVILAAALHPTAPALLAGVVLFLATSLRSLLELTEEVIELTESAPDEARTAVRGLVGRDASDLSPAQLRSAAIESAAENLSDGFVATLVPFVLLAPFSLPAAAAVATWVKGVNTLDSMLGYPDKPIGTASARLDDAVMWLPARLTAASLAVAAGQPRALLSARRWAGAPPSPNAGWPMAVAAAALSVRLEKPGVYALNPDGGEPAVADGDRALALIGLGAVVAVVIAVTGTIVLETSVDAIEANRGALVAGSLAVGRSIRGPAPERSPPRRSTSGRARSGRPSTEVVP